MTEVHFEKTINVEEMLAGFQYTSSNSGPAMMISADDGDIDKIYSLLKENENHYKIYLKNEIPEYYHFSKSPMISEILLVADMGWAVITNNDVKWMKPENYNGNHGYDNHHLDMHGIFIASGPEFKNNYNHLVHQERVDWEVHSEKGWSRLVGLVKILNDRRLAEQKVPVKKTARIAQAQVNATVGDLVGNYELVKQQIEKGKAQDADIVVLPELVMTACLTPNLRAKSDSN